MEDLTPDQTALLGVIQLLNRPGLTPSLTSLIGDRRFPVVAPDSTPSPYVVFGQIEEEYSSTKDGEIPNGWSFQVLCYADNILDAKKIARAARRAINGQTADIEGVSKMYFSFTDEMDDYNEKRELFIVALNFRAYQNN